MTAETRTMSDEDAGREEAVKTTSLDNDLCSRRRKNWRN